MISQKCPIINLSAIFCCILKLAKFFFLMNKNFIKSKQTNQQRTPNTSPSKRLNPQPQRGLKPIKTTKTQSCRQLTSSRNYKQTENTTRKFSKKETKTNKPTEARHHKFCREHYSNNSVGKFHMETKIRFSLVLENFPFPASLDLTSQMIFFNNCSSVLG